MVSDLFLYALLLLGLLWLCIMLHGVWPYDRPAGDQRPSKPATPPRKPSRAPKPFPGLIHKPPCAACEQAHEPTPNGQNIRTCLSAGVYLLTFKDKRESEGSTGTY